MIELLNNIWNLLTGVADSLLGLAISVSLFGWDLLVWLHVSSPRLEGLLVGILSAWLLLRRDKHPVLRVLSAPLKLVVDILDLAWSQVTEVVSDLWDTAKNWTFGPLNWVKGKVKNAYSWVVGSLTNLKNKLIKKAE